MGPLVAALALMAGGEWSPRRAADYLDARQKVWNVWPRANRGGSGPCLACHGGLHYALARPALRRALNEDAPAPYETAILDGVRRRLTQAQGTEAVLAALVLARRGVMDADTEQAFERLWKLQTPEGAWAWLTPGEDPWEQPESVYYGAALAALAAGEAPGDYQSRAGIRVNLDALRAYLAGRQSGQPLHNRLALLWASTVLRGTLPESARQAIVKEVLSRQESDGGWTIASLGPWRAHAAAPPSSGSSAYATALVAFVLQRAGARTGTALDWLRSHQDPAGYWEAVSMNKPHPEDSVERHFMREAATALAALALLEAR
jgi:squalene-hopene/tetraprenyl-beta-curcumene cyclase